MTISSTRKLSVMALGLSLALAMSIGTAAAKDRQPKRNKGAARAKKVRDGAKKNADGAMRKRRKARQAARLKIVNAIVTDLTEELDLNDEQKIKIEEIIKKHLKVSDKGKGKARGDAKKRKNRKGRRGGKRKGKNAAKGDAGPGIDRF